MQETRFKTMTKEKLISHFEMLVKNENEILLEILEMLREFDRRKTFLELGYSSLFDFLVRGYKYSPDQAQRRIAAARLSRFIPGSIEKIETGELTLTNASTLFQYLRVEETQSSEVKKELLHLACIESKDAFQQTLVHKSSNVDIAKKVMTEKAKPVTESLTKLELILKTETLEQLKKLSELKSNQLNNKTKLSDVIELLVHEEIKRFDKRKQRGEKKLMKQTQTATQTQTEIEITLPGKVNLTTPQPQKRPHINKAKQTFLLTKASYSCQAPGCTARKYLHIDHVIPIAKNGNSDLSNLQILCSNHNLKKGDSS